MTAIYYPDCRAVSPNGQFALDARSPHNGTIPHCDGRAPTADEYQFKYRDHQCEFRYRLMACAGGAAVADVFGASTSKQVVWERWQGKSEDSPGELVVADDGWSVIRTHGFRPEVIAVSSAGHDAVRVRILGPETPGENPDCDAEDSGTEGASYSWRTKHFAWSTAGSFWAEHSWRFFFAVGGRPHFAWRTCCGERLVIDLTSATLIPESNQREGAIARAMDDEERRGVFGLLSGLSSRWDEVQGILACKDIDAAGDDADVNDRRHGLRDGLRRVNAALYLAGVLRLAECVPFLRQWETVARRAYTTSSTALFRRGSLEPEYFRRVAQHALRLLGEEPGGYPAYHFVGRDNARLPMSERCTDRDKQLAGLDRGQSASEVLQRVGSPDHVRQQSHREGTLYRWTEEWEYDVRLAHGGWVTTRVTWAEDGKTGRIVAVEEVPAYWLASDQRAMEILRF